MTSLLGRRAVRVGVGPAVSNDSALRGSCGHHLDSGVRESFAVVVVLHAPGEEDGQLAAGQEVRVVQQCVGEVPATGRFGIGACCRCKYRKG